MGIVSVPSSVSRLSLLSLLGLIVLSFTASEQCILTVSSGFNESHINMELWGKKFYGDFGSGA